MCADFAKVAEEGASLRSLLSSVLSVTSRRLTGALSKLLERVESGEVFEREGVKVGGGCGHLHVGASTQVAVCGHHRLLRGAVPRLLGCFNQCVKMYPPAGHRLAGGYLCA